MPNPKPYNAEVELSGLVLMVEELLDLEDKLEGAPSHNTSGLRRNINMKRRNLKSAIAQYKMLRKQKVTKPKHTQPVYGTQGWLYK